MYPVLFKIGPITIYTYGFFVFLGVITGYFVCRREAQRQGIKNNLFADLFFWILVWSFIGARILYIFVNFSMFLKMPFVVGLSRSGFVFYGGLIFGILSLYWFVLKYKLNFFKLLDIFALGVPLGHAFGRIGCFFYGCCYGKPTQLFFGVLFPPDSPAGLTGEKIIPVQLIEALFLFVLFYILFLFRRHKKIDGQICAVYCVVYGIFRFGIEFLRGDYRGHILALTTSQLTALVFIISGIILWIFLKKNRKK